MGSKRVEMEFITEKFTLSHMNMKRTFIAKNTNTGRIEGYVVCNPAFAINAYELDLFRRRKNATRNVMKYLVFNILETWKAEGLDTAGFGEIH